MYVKTVVAQFAINVRTTILLENKWFISDHVYFKLVFKHDVDEKSICSQRKDFNDEYLHSVFNYIIISNYNPINITKMTTAQNRLKPRVMIFRLIEKLYWKCHSFVLVAVMTVFFITKFFSVTIVIWNIFVYSEFL